MAIIGFSRASSGAADAASAAVARALDASQQAVLALEPSTSAVVLGAPGTGKTTTLVELAADRIARHGFTADSIVVLAATRASATRLRDTLALRLGVATNGALARTAPSLAFELVRAAAAVQGAPAPRLLTGAEQDADLDELLLGQIEDGTGGWPDDLGPEVRRLPAFRSELRELIGRAVERGISSDRMRELAASWERPAWRAAAGIRDEYDEVRALRGAVDEGLQQFDAAELLAFAVAAIDAGSAGERIDRIRLVLVDDLQDATEATLSLLAALVRRGVTVVAAGDPDVAVNAFRGGEADAVGRLGERLGIRDLPTLVLSTSHRQPDALRALTTRVTARIGAAGAGRQHAASGSGAGGSTARVIGETPARSLAGVARDLRRSHLRDGVPWTDMVVVVRSRAQIPAVRRALALAEVPARTTVGGTALRDDRAARALLQFVEIAVGRVPVTGALAAELLRGPYGGVDALGLRRLRLALRAEELAGDGSRPADELLAEALDGPGRLTTIDHPAGRRASRLADTIDALRTAAAAGGTVEELLWSAWERSGVARPWYEQALGTGVIAAEANADLDGVVALFTAAKRHVERRPTDGPGGFLAAVLDAEVPEDTLSPQPEESAVLVTTPPGLVGLDAHTVVVAGLQDGIWPNLRARGSLLQADALLAAHEGRALDGAVDERRLVRDDELRLFALAVGSARSRVVLAAVANDDESPSPLMEFAPDAEELDAREAPLTLRSAVARLRRSAVAAPTSARGRAAASALAGLADEGVPGADPSGWHGILPVSTEQPVFDPAEAVNVSPSQIGAVEASAMDWFIGRVAGSEPSTPMALGTVLHSAMERTSLGDVEPTLEAVWALVEERWGELPFESPWIAEREKAFAQRLAAGIAEYLADFRREGKTLVGAESRFRLELEGAVLNGSIDRVERSADGSVVIVDLKTGRAETDAEALAAHPQLAAYQLAFVEGVLDESLAEHGEAASHRRGGAKLLFVRDGVKGKSYREGVQQPYTDDDLQGFRDRITEAAAVMHGPSFPGPAEMVTRYGDSVLGIHRVRAVSSD